MKTVATYSVSQGRISIPIDLIVIVILPLHSIIIMMMMMMMKVIILHHGITSPSYQHER